MRPAWLGGFFEDDATCRLLDGLGQRYHKLPSELLERGMVKLMFDAECSVLGAKAELDGKPARLKAEQIEQMRERAIAQLPEGSPFRKQLEESRGR